MTSSCRSELIIVTLGVTLKSSELYMKVVIDRLEICVDVIGMFHKNTVESSTAIVFFFIWCAQLSENENRPVLFLSSCKSERGVNS